MRKIEVDIVEANSIYYLCLYSVLTFFLSHRLFFVEKKKDKKETKKERKKENKTKQNKRQKNEGKEKEKENKINKGKENKRNAMTSSAFFFDQLELPNY